MNKGPVPAIVDPESIKRAQTLAEEERILAKNKKTLKETKKRLFIYLFLITFFLLIIIFERVIFYFLLSAENSFIEILQRSFRIDDPNESIPFFNFMGSIGGYRFFVLIILHIYIFLYFVVNPFLTVKLMVAHFIGLYLVYLLQLLYSVPRPFWMDSKIVSFYCDGSFLLPDDFNFSLVFMILYTFFCYENGLQINQSMLEDPNASMTVLEKEVRRRKKVQICKIGVWVLYFFIMILRYLIGIMYLDSIVMTSFYAIIFFAVMAFSETYYDNSMKRSVIEVSSAKKLLFYWAVVLILLQCFAIILYLTIEEYIPVDWISNYINCMNGGSASPEDSYKVYVDDSIGGWYTFIGTSVIIINIGCLFGAFKSNIKMRSMTWHLGSYKQKIARIAIAYILLIPSWILQYYLPNIISNNLVTSFLINEFFLNMLHFTIIIYLEFGYVPFYILKKLKLTNQEENMGFQFLPGNSN